MNMLAGAATMQVKPPLLLLHGWGFDRSVFQPWEADLARYFHVRYADLPGYGDAAPALHQWCAELAAQLPQPVVLLGWSLGGQAAIQFAHRYPAKVKALINLAGNPSFVQRDDWPSAMPAATFNNFEHGFSTHPQQTLRRFSGLVTHAACDARQLQKSLRVLLPTAFPALAAQQQGLTFLRNWDLRSELMRLNMPVLHVLGEQDQLVPPALAHSLRAIVPRQRVYCVSGAGHAIFLHNGAALAAQISQFLAGDSTHGIAKTRVAESFSKAATGYDAVAHLQRQVGDRLFDLLASEDCAAVLDLGCGTGGCLPALRRRFPAAALFAVDIARGMLVFARARHSAIDCTMLCADAEGLPLADESVDCIFSNLALQWCDLASALRECKRVLKPGGRLYVSTLGPATLRELRAAWSEVDDYVHVNHFAPIDSVYTALAGSGLQDYTVTRELITLQYHDVRALTGELKALGAHNINSGAPRGLTGKKRLRALLCAYEQRRNARDMLPASYEAFYVTATNPGA